MPAYVPVGNPAGGGTGEGSSVAVGVDAACAVAAGELAAAAVELLELPHPAAAIAPAAMAQMARIRRIPMAGLLPGGRRSAVRFSPMYYVGRRGNDDATG